MANLTPASNVQAATVAGFIAVLVEHLCTANGIDIPPDVADALPGLFVVLVAYAHDCLSTYLASRTKS